MPLCALLLGLVMTAAPAAPLAAIDVSGVVRDSYGAPVSGAEIGLLTPELSGVARTKTDAEGKFTLPAPAPGTYLLVVRAEAFSESHHAVTVGAQRRLAARHRHPPRGAPGGSHGDRVPRHRRGAPPRRPAGQHHRRERDRQSRQDRRRPGARRGGRRAPSADEPDDGRHLRARVDRQQGQHLRRRRALFERRAARRRQHLPRSHRAGMARDDRGPPRSVERAVRERRARGQRAVSHARARARRGGRARVARFAGRRRRHRASNRRRQRVPGVYGESGRPDGQHRRAQGRRVPSGRRHRLARGGHAFPRRPVDRAHGRAPSGHGLRAVRGGAALELGAECENPPRRRATCGPTRTAASDTTSCSAATAT